MDNNEEDNHFPHGPWLIFPEIIGVAVVAILAPFSLIEMYSNGKIIVPIIGFCCWLIALVYTVIFIKKGQYYLAWLPMCGILMVGLLINYTTK
tara:strand:- start:37755 stop:38033 length:279 start_codon:yes stop_codon:yes gene_type:complete